MAASRLDLLHSLISKHTFNIDGYHRNTPDKSFYQGHYYSDKAPGIVLLALPAFSLTAGMMALCDIPLDSESGWLISSWVACGGALGVITAFGGTAMFAWLCGFVRPRTAYVSTLALFLGAAPLPYSTLLMSHALVVGLIAIAIGAAIGINNPCVFNGRTLVCRRALVSGFCCGLALASEYSAGIAVLGVFAYIIFRRAYDGVSFLLGSLPALLTIPVYHLVCFGNALEFAYHNEAVFREMHEGFFGITLPPSAEAIYCLLLSKEHGLFIWTPVLLLSFVGYTCLTRHFKYLFWVFYLVPVLQTFIIGAYFLPSGGTMIGPRLLSPVLPFLALPTAIGMDRFPRIGYALAAVSIVLTILATAIGIVWPDGSSMVSFYVDGFNEGKFAHNLGTAIGLDGFQSLLPIGVLLSFLVWKTWHMLPGNNGGNEQPLSAVA